MKILNKIEKEQIRKMKIAREYTLHVIDYLKGQIKGQEAHLEGLERIINDIELDN